MVGVIFKILGYILSIPFKLIGSVFCLAFFLLTVLISVGKVLINIIYWIGIPVLMFFSIFRLPSSGPYWPVIKRMFTSGYIGKFFGFFFTGKLVWQMYDVSMVPPIVIMAAFYFAVFFAIKWFKNYTGMEKTPTPIEAFYSFADKMVSWWSIKL